MHRDDFWKGYEVARETKSQEKLTSTNTRPGGRQNTLAQVDLAEAATRWPKCPEDVIERLEPNVGFEYSSRLYRGTVCVCLWDKSQGMVFNLNRIDRSLPTRGVSCSRPIRYNAYGRPLLEPLDLLCSN